MDRREFVRGAALAGVATAVGGGFWARAAYERHQLVKKLISDAQPDLTEKARVELLRLPVKARDEIRTWFHAPCLNSAEFVYEICSHSFAEKLSACATAECQEMCLLNAFVSKVVSATEILNRVGIIAEEIGSELDLNWAACCARISNKWDLHIKPYGLATSSDFASRMEPLIRQGLDETLRRASVAGQRPALGNTVDKIGESALMLLTVIDFPKFAIPLFALIALRHLIRYIVSQLNNKIGDYQRAISERLALLANRIGSEFEAEIRRQIANLHTWQEDALRVTADEQAQMAITIF